MSMSPSPRYLFVNGIVSPLSDTPPVSTLLQSHPGAYTTTRTHNNASHLLFWERHLTRLANSTTILFNSNPNLLFKPQSTNTLIPSIQSSVLESIVSSLVNDSIRQAFPVALEHRKTGEELAITTLLTGNLDKLSRDREIVDEQSVSRVLDVYVHVGMYVPPLFGNTHNSAHLAMVGRGRDVANAKYSDWVRLRRPLEKLRPPLATELLLSNDGDQILEGCLTNVFIVTRKYKHEEDNASKDLRNFNKSYSLEIQTAPVSDGVLPGVVRQVIIEVCLQKGIPFREVAPSWSERELWEEAFVTNSLRLLQHVETIRVPTSWENMESKTWKDLTWEEKRFKDGPGRITTLIQNLVMERASLEGFSIASLNG